MQALTFLTVALQFAMKLVDLWREKDFKTAQEKAVVLKKAVEGVQNSDIKSIVDTFNRVRPK